MECICGSGKEMYSLFDARGIYLSGVCEDCESTIKRRYRKDVLEDSEYECDEQIEPD